MFMDSNFAIQKFEESNRSPVFVSLKPNLCRLGILVHHAHLHVHGVLHSSSSRYQGLINFYPMCIHLSVQFHLKL